MESYRKGISPVVATVVLVVAAILIGSTATVWISGVDATSGTPNQAVNVTQGQSALLDVNTTWNSGNSGNQMKSFKVRNDKCKNYFVPTTDFTVV